MPTVGNKKFQYTPKGFTAAMKESKKTGKKVVNKKYEKGGVNAPKGFHFMKKGSGKYKLMKHGDKPFKPHKGANLKAKFPTQKKHSTKYEEGGEVEKYQAPSFSDMFDVGSKMKLGGGPASERAKMRHERKMARQSARADRKMVRTEGRQQRRADKQAGRQETRIRRQDRKDQRQDSRLGYYKEGGVDPKFKNKPSVREARELAYKAETGQEYEDSPEGTNLTTTPISEFQEQEKFEYVPKKNIFGKIKTGKVDGNEYVKYKKKKKKKKGLFGNKESLKIDSLKDQERRQQIDESGDQIHGSKNKRRTKSYEITDKDGKKKKVYFKNQEEADRYFKNIEKDTGKVRVNTETDILENELKNKYIPEEGKEDIYTEDTIGDVSKDKTSEDIASMDRHVGGRMTDERKKELEKKGKQEQFEKEEKFETDIRDLAKDSPGTGVTETSNKLTFEGPQTNLKNPDKYYDRERKAVVNYKTGKIEEKVKRTGVLGLLGGYKKTGREKDDEFYQEAGKNKNQERTENKPNNSEKKENKKKKKEEKKKQADAARQARAEGKSSYVYNGITYNITPNVMKQGGTLMERYNRKIKNK
jgi:hypothetical protein